MTRWLCPCPLGWILNFSLATSRQTLFSVVANKCRLVWSSSSSKKTDTNADSHMSSEHFELMKQRQWTRLWDICAHGIYNYHQNYCPYSEKEEDEFLEGKNSTEWMVCRFQSKLHVQTNLHVQIINFNFFPRKNMDFPCRLCTYAYQYSLESTRICIHNQCVAIALWDGNFTPLRRNVIHESMISVRFPQFMHLSFNSTEFRILRPHRAQLSSDDTKDISGGNVYLLSLWEIQEKWNKQTAPAPSIASRFRAMQMKTELFVCALVNGLVGDHSKAAIAIEYMDMDIECCRLPTPGTSCK